MRLLSTLLLTCLLAAAGLLHAQSQPITPFERDGAASSADVTFLNLVQPELFLAGKAAAGSVSEVTLRLPTPSGDELVVTVAEAPVMPSALAAKYPMLRTFRGMTADGAVVAVTQTAEGLSVFVKYPSQPSWAIEMIGQGRARLGLTAVIGEELMIEPPALSCGYTPAAHEQEELQPAFAKTSQNRTVQQVKVTKRKYVLALACTGEYGARYGGTKPAVMATFVAALNILNGITLPEVGVEFELHPETDTLIFTNPNTDPYTNSDMGGALLGQNPTVINARIPNADYDLGHVFTNRCRDVGGVVSGNACTPLGKARGVTCHYSGLTRIVEDVMAHEVAHQFDVDHTWNNCPGADGQRRAESAYEPGSGSTIMSYQGACGADNNVSTIPAPVYYHVQSLQQFIDFTAMGAGGDCADYSVVNNEYPEINWPYINGFAIPISTPFVLRASATDADGDQLFYNWEQYDLGPATPLCDPRDGAPMFRSVPPTPNGNVRYFPKEESVRLGLMDCEEILPDYGREMNFRMTARDMREDAGGTVWEQVMFNVDGDSGPFTVTSQSSLAATYVAGEFVQVTWDVANTNVAPVNCQAVNILLSMDNGRTYPHVLASNTNNDGAEGVSLPIVDGSNARIKVEAADNIFYALSASRFTIIEPTEPGFTFVSSESSTFLCLPDTAEVDLFTSSLLGYDSTLTLRIVNQLPAGIDASLDQTQLSPGDAARLTVNFDNFNRSDSVTIIIEASGNGVDTARRELLFDVVSNDFSDVELLSPANGEEGVLEVPVFEFTASAAAEEYIIEVSDDPLFDRGSFLIPNADPDGETLGSLLEPNTVYFWRVLPKNRCGIFYDLPINAFHTFAASCESYSQTESIIIPPRIRDKAEAVVPVSSSGTVNDLNIPLVNVKYSDINDIRVSLESPDGTEVTLVANRCGGTNRLITGFDDESPLQFSCTPVPNDGAVRRPLNPLSTFDGSEINGDWILRVQVINPSNEGGEFNEFQIQFCANIISQSPVLEHDLVTVPTGGFQYLDPTFLRASDPDNSVSDLRYIIVKAPTRGHIEKYGVPLQVGDSWTQAQSQTAGVTYVDDLGVPGTDEMSVVLTDNSGNLIATPVINFDIANNYTTSTKESVEAVVDMSLAPNPTSSTSRVQWTHPSAGGELRVFDMQGRLMHRRAVEQGLQAVDLEVGQWPAGMYVVAYRGKDGARALRLAVE